jgi:hypothetical protein
MLLLISKRLKSRPFSEIIKKRFVTSRCSLAQAFQMLDRVCHAVRFITACFYEIRPTRTLRPASRASYRGAAGAPTGDRGGRIEAPQAE